MEIRLHAAVPPKPSFGAACNGCGACCAVAPCPVSWVLLGHRRYACPALSWHDADRRYYCGMVLAPATHLCWLPTALQSPAARLIRRWIAADSGCDCDVELS